MSKAGPGVLFVDRDGTIIEDVWNLSEIRNIFWLPHARNILGQLSAEGWKVVIVTNQPCVGRDVITWEQYKAVEQVIEADLKAHGVNLLGTYVCPHTSFEDCHCRKPKTGLFHAASQDYDILFTRGNHWMIGDKLEDTIAGDHCRLNTIYLGTPRGEDPSIQHYAQNWLNVYDIIKDSHD